MTPKPGQLGPASGICGGSWCHGARLRGGSCAVRCGAATMVANGSTRSLTSLTRSTIDPARHWRANTQPVAHPSLHAGGRPLGDRSSRTKPFAASIHPHRALAEPAVRQAAPSAHFMWTNIYCLSEYWTDRFPRKPRQKVKPSERCDHERNGKQERPQLSYHNQGTLTAAVGQDNATSILT